MQIKCRRHQHRLLLFRIRRRRGRCHLFEVSEVKHFQIDLNCSIF